MSNSSTNPISTSNSRPWLWATLGGGLVAIVLLVGAFLLWPRVSLSPSKSSLASFSTHGPNIKIASIQGKMNSKTIPMVTKGSQIDPASPIPMGKKVLLSISATPPSWMTWLVGHKINSHLVVSTPTAKLTSSMVFPSAGSEPTAKFNQTIKTMTWNFNGTSHVVHLTHPSQTVPLPISTTQGSGGVIEISASAYNWEIPPSPSALSFFVGKGQMATVSPTPNSTNTPSTTPIQLTFSQPTTKILGTNLPTITIAKLHSSLKGHWTHPNSYTLEFIPAHLALWPGQTVQIRFPNPIKITQGTSVTTTQNISYTTKQGSTTRLQQLLANLGYLPLNWTSVSKSAPSLSSASVIDSKVYSTPNGNFSWQWQPPARLASLWQPGVYNPMVKGAVMAFEHVDGLNPVGRSNPLLWSYLVKAVAMHKTNPNGYAWVDVSKTISEHLVLWLNGKPILTALTNTGIPATPTHSGTYPIYIRYRTQVMKGRNPNGSKYSDLVHWVSYFNGGNAVHGFVRASYGTPQSLGCVELPIATAAQVWPNLHIGSLVTVHP